MNKLPVIAIFDVGKTNKKLLLFDELYNVVFETSAQLEETSDEDGFACEDIHALSGWIKSAFETVTKDERFAVKAVNFSGYGASFIYIDKNGNIAAPLYNYLKPYNSQLQKEFYKKYGGESAFAKQTASPVLGNLNSGMQLYRLKYEKPELFNNIAFALHLPQYLSYILTGKTATDITSIGCHTNLWNFQSNTYHNWLSQENIGKKLAEIKPCKETFPFTFNGKQYIAGIGLHDSSAALIPYLASVNEPFVLLSTGTWSISLNPFNHTQLSDYELHHDCLCYLTYEDKPVKASRLFAGYEHEQQTKRLATHFNKDLNYYKTVVFDKIIFKILQPLNKRQDKADEKVMIQQSIFASRDLNVFSSYEIAYHQLIADIMQQQVRSTKLVLNATNVKNIFVDGGFSRNKIFMCLLAKAFPSIKVYAASVAQASALGAALAIHKQWNKNTVPVNLIKLELYKSS